MSHVTHSQLFNKAHSHMCNMTHSHMCGISHSHMCDITHSYLGDTNCCSHLVYVHQKQPIIWEYTATLCSTLQHPATPCNTLQHPATPCNTPVDSERRTDFWRCDLKSCSCALFHFVDCSSYERVSVLLYVAVCCSVMQCVAACCNVLQ